MADQTAVSSAEQRSGSTQAAEVASKSTAEPPPQLRTLVVADRPESWATAGFHLQQDGGRESVVIGSIRIVFEPDPAQSGITRWEFNSDQLTVTDSAIDGIPTLAVSDEPSNASNRRHPNEASRIDHVVVTTSHLERTLGALDAAGFRVRRSRDVPGSDKKQVFLWAGETILEVVGPPVSASSNHADSPSTTEYEPAKLWGLAITSDDLKKAAETLGSSLSEPKEAVQPNRKVATIATSQLGISVPMILMTPHIPVNKAD